MRCAVPLAPLFLLSACMSESVGELLRGPPAIVSGIPESATVPNAQFTTRLRELYPVGSNEADLVERLERERFEFKPDSRASYVWSNLACSVLVSVDWEAEGGKITHIEGVYGSACM